MSHNSDRSAEVNKQSSGHIQDSGAQDEKIENSQTKKEGRPGKKGSLQNSRNNSRCNSQERPRPLSPSDSGNWQCDTCTEIFRSSNDKLLTCDCGNHRCIDCLGMNKSVYKGISGRADLPWFCTNCVVKSLECLKQNKTIEDKCAEYIADFQKRVDERINKLELEVSSFRSDMESFKSEIVAEVRGMKDKRDTQQETTDLHNAVSIPTGDTIDSSSESHL